MSKRDLALRVGGAAGDGVSSTAESFAKISARSGLHTWTYSSYQSVIRGGHAVKDMGGPLPLGLAYPNQAKYLMPGNEAVCLGALAAGVKFLAQYPMTPASSILHWMAAHGPKYGVVVKQVEDELAAMNMAVGAGFAGVRSMTATSGGGFSLMVEAIGQAGMTETPLVAVLVQRSGPSTGLPTKTEQGDLNLALGAGQGDWPRAILAPRHPEECFSLTAQAFNLAEIYQTPVIVISDLYLGEGFRTVEKPDFNVPIVRGMMAADGGTAKDFRRYQITESGVSPRALPGTKGFQFIGATDEHMESGELISDVLSGLPEFVEERRKMHEKRMRKLDGLRKDTPRPEIWGPKNADLTVILWGSTWGAAHEAILQVQEKEGLKANSLEFPTIFPFHVEETLQLLRGVKQSLAVEGNYTGQFSRLLRAETGYKPDHFYGRYDGEPFASRDIADKIVEVVA